MSLYTDDSINYLQPFSRLSFLYTFSYVIHSKSLKYHLNSFHSCETEVCADICPETFAILCSCCVQESSSFFPLIFHFKINEAMIQFKEQTRNYMAPLIFIFSSLSCLDTSLPISKPFQPILKTCCLFSQHKPQTQHCSPPFLMMSHHHLFNPFRFQYLLHDIILHTHVSILPTKGFFFSRSSGMNGWNKTHISPAQSHYHCCPAACRRKY